MDTALLIRGIVLGFTIASTVGPISLLVIRRTLNQGWSVGFASGLGVATADTIYGGVAAFGLTVVSDFLVGQARLLDLVGGLALLYIGFTTARTRPTTMASTDNAGRRGLARAYGSIVGLTLTNPLTILIFGALFVGFAVSSSTAGAASITAGVFVGSTTWWLLLTGTVAALRARVTPRVLRWVNLVSGIAILGFAVLILAVAIRG